MKTYESQDQAQIECSELYREPSREDERLKQLYKTQMYQIKDQDTQVTEQGPIYIISMSDKAALSTTWKSSLKTFTIIKITLLAQAYKPTMPWKLLCQRLGKKNEIQVE